MKKYNICIDGHLIFETDDIAKAVHWCRNMICAGLEKEAITVWNADGHMIALQF